MANPWHPADRRFLPKGTGVGGVEAGLAAAEVEEGGGTQGDESAAPPSPVRRDQGQECHEATESGTKNEKEDEKEYKEEGDRDRETSRGAPVDIVLVGGDVPPLEENTDLTNFKPESAHLLLWEVYGDYMYHNDRSHLDGGVTDNAIWQHRWRRLAV